MICRSQWRCWLRWEGFRIAVLDDVLIVGEIGLNGVVQPVHGVLPMVAEAKERGIRRCIVPRRIERGGACFRDACLRCGKYRGGHAAS